MRHIGLIEAQPQETPAVFICPHCGKEYKSEAALKAHCKKEHPQSFDNEE
jgi:transcription elongation factor Elf1